ncbi:doublecortin domain-containing 5 [Pelobates cultripes]|uniref:Doublecortin domain-containing 5 n=1 Tax=Pelobates cultripes TaxID=61616 RepID=A0AAD1TJB9_PELCU|nr:doublecortin domain-containing 5 [Pelobates cultripes]
MDPRLSAAECKKQLLLSNLTSDASLIRNYCCLRNPENLVLEVCGDIVAGANLTINNAVSVPSEDETAETNEESESDVIQDIDEFLDSHARAHRKVDAMYSDIRYAWQHTMHDPEEQNIFTSQDPVNDLQNLYRSSRKVIKVPQIHRQQFEFLDGQIINSAFPGLVLGVDDSEVHAGVHVQLIDRRLDDMNQHWKYLEESRTFHLSSCLELVLAVSMPKVYPGQKHTEKAFPGCNLILQKYMEHVNGAANQKWCYIPDMKVLGAFHSDQLDKEITAANQASVCTFTVANAAALSQPGYAFLSSNGKEKVMTCLSCARTMRGHREMMKVPAGNLFFCASGQKNSKLSPTGPFKCLHVSKTDLSTSEAENTLSCLEEMISTMIFERSTQTIAHKLSTAVNQRVLKIKAYRNGSGFKNGRLIIATSFPMLLTMCTKELELPRHASRLYSSDGTVILTWEGLIVSAMNEFFKQNEDPAQHGPRSSDTQKDTQPMQDKSKPIMVTPEDLNIIDEDLLAFTLRNPIEVWVSCGEPFLSFNALQRSQKLDKLLWLQKERIRTDLNGMKHKMRHLQGNPIARIVLIMECDWTDESCWGEIGNFQYHCRRVKFLNPSSITPTRNPMQPVLVEGGWTEETDEEIKLIKTIQNEEKHLSEIQAAQLHRHAISGTVKEASQKALYNCPTSKRVLVYLNGGNPEQAVFAWGKTLEELLDNCTARLIMQPHPAAALFTSNGEKVTSWSDIEKDMLLCVSAGEKFVSKAASRRTIQVKANYARIRRKYGPEATDVILSPKCMDCEVSVCQRDADADEEGNELTFQKCLT